MKHNWEYKRLGDICTVIGGSTPKTDVSEYWNGLLNWFTPAEISDKKYYSDSERKITPEAVKAAGLTLMPAGTVLLTSRAPIGKVGITTIESYCNQGFKNFVCGDSILNEYLYYALIHFNDDIKGMGHGATFKEISKKTTENIEIPVPPMAVQQRIVAELDKINEVIDDCRELLRNLDALAQSLFNDYFGDPAINPKGWQTKSLDEICEAISTGITYKPDNVADFGTIVLRSSNIQNSSLVLDDIVRIDMPLKPSQYVQKNDILMCSRNGSARLVGKVALIPELKEKMSWGAFMTIIRSNYYYFLFQYFRLPAFREQLTKTKTTTVNQITIGMLKKIHLPVPPLSLQKKFAERIEQIEAQKKIVESTIAELQTLLDSRMDYWFN